jgi:DNA-binding LacI/PurR family transcriptional regulator
MAIGWAPGSWPEDISIVSFDDSNGEPARPVTTIDIAVEEMNLAVGC